MVGILEHQNITDSNNALKIHDADLQDFNIFIDKMDPGAALEVQEWYNNFIANRAYEMEVAKNRAEGLKLKKKYEHDFIGFCTNIFSRTFHVPFSIIHKELIQIVLQMIMPERQKDLACIMFPRGFGKTSIVGFAFVMWCALYRKKRFIIYLCNSADVARNERLYNIKYELENNTTLLYMFGIMARTATTPLRAVHGRPTLSPWPTVCE